MKYPITTLCLVFLCSCLNETQQDVPEVEEEVAVQIDEDTLNQLNPVPREVPEGWFQVDFEGLSIQMKETDLWWEGQGIGEANIYKTKDTAFFDLFPGNWMFDEELKILESAYDQIQFFTKNVVKVGVDSERTLEVPFCVIGNWKSSESKWIEINGDNSTFIFESQLDYITDSITYELDEFMSAVKTNCGLGWHEEMLNYTSVDSLPTSEFISEYHYKIIASNSESGATIEKILIFYTPTSC